MHSSTVKLLLYEVIIYYGTAQYGMEQSSTLITVLTVVQYTSIDDEMRSLLTIHADGYWNKFSQQHSHIKNSMSKI